MSLSEQQIIDLELKAIDDFLNKDKKIMNTTQDQKEYHDAFKHWHQCLEKRDELLKKSKPVDLELIAKLWTTKEIKSCEDSK